VKQRIGCFVVSLVPQVLQITEEPHNALVSFKYHLTHRSFAVMKTILWICIKQVMFYNIKCIDILVVTCSNSNKFDTMKICKTKYQAETGNILAENRHTCNLHILCELSNYVVGRDSSVVYSDLLRAGQSRDRIPMGARFSAPIQIGPGALPASYTMGTGSFLG
jgi:hypothetical protein